MYGQYLIRQKCTLLQLFQGEGQVRALIVTQKMEGKIGQWHVRAESEKNRRKAWRLPEG